MAESDTSQGGQKKASSSAQQRRAINKFVDVFSRHYLEGTWAEDGFSCPSDEIIFLADREATRMPALVVGGSVVKVSKETAKQAVSRYLQPYSESPHVPYISPSTVSDIYSKFSSSAEPNKIEDVLPMAEKSYPGLTWNRLPFDIDDGEGKETPLFDNFLDRVGNSEAVMAWVYGLLVKDHPREKYLWLHGEGADGKSKFTDAIRWMMRQCATTVTSPRQLEDNHWSECLINNRLIVFADWSKTSTPSTGAFKSLTGDEFRRVNPKNQASFEARIDSMVIFTSNNAPTVGSSTADRRRLIYCPVSELKESDRVHDAILVPGLRAEMPAFLYKCRAIYDSMRDKYGHFHMRVDESLNRDLIEQNEEDLEDWFEETFQLTEEGFITSKRLHSEIEAFKAKSDFRKNTPAIRAWVKSRTKMETGLARVGGKVTRVWKGLALRCEAEPTRDF